MCSSWLSLFLGGMAPQYPLGRSQLDDCSRSEGRMGRKKGEVRKIQDTGLRHRNVSRTFGDSCTEMGCADAAGQVSPCGCHSRKALCPMKIDHLSHP